MKPFEVVKGGRKVWCVDIPPSYFGKRKRLFRETKAEVEAAAETKLRELRFGQDAANISGPERGFILRWLRPQNPGEPAPMTLAQLEEAAREMSQRVSGAKTARQAMDSFLRKINCNSVAQRLQNELRGTSPQIP